MGLTGIDVLKKSQLVDLLDVSIEINEASVKFAQDASNDVTVSRNTMAIIEQLNNVVQMLNISNMIAAKAMVDREN